MPLVPVPITDRPPAKSGHLNMGLKAVAVHAAVSLIIGTYVFILVLFHDLSNDVALGIFGTIVGAHTTAAAGVQLHRRRTDPDDGQG